MATFARYCPSCLLTVSRLRPSNLLSHVTPILPRALLIASYHTTPALQAKKADKKPTGSRPAPGKAKNKKKKKARTTYLEPELKDVVQFNLVDAMRYIRAAEVGQGPKSVKYELHVRLRSKKNGPVVRNRLQLPHAVNTGLRIAVICPPDSAAAQDAAAAGAVLIGEDNIFDAVRDGRIEFDRLLCHTESLQKLGKAGIARALGPRGLMPSTKLGTVSNNIALAVRGMVGGSEYRERLGVVRIAIGQLGFTPQELQQNIKFFMDTVKGDIAGLSENIVKEIHEVVLSSTHGPGFSLNGELRGPMSVPDEDLSTL